MQLTYPAQISNLSKMTLVWQNLNLFDKLSCTKTCTTGFIWMVKSDAKLIIQTLYVVIVVIAFFVSLHNHPFSNPNRSKTFGPRQTHHNYSVYYSWFCFSVVLVLIHSDRVITWVSSKFRIAKVVSPGLPYCTMMIFYLCLAISSIARKVEQKSLQWLNIGGDDLHVKYTVSTKSEFNSMSNNPHMWSYLL